VPRKRKVVYPPPRSSKAPPPPNRIPVNPPTLAVINRNAGKGRADIVAGAHVTIVGTGSDVGETGIVERLVGGVIPAAVVKLEGGRTRRVRTVDLAPATGQGRAAEAE